MQISDTAVVYLMLRVGCLFVLLAVCYATSSELEITKPGKVFSSVAKSLKFPTDLEQFKSKAVSDEWGENTQTVFSFLSCIPHLCNLHSLIHLHTRARTFYRRLASEGWDERHVTGFGRWQ